jgi:isoquinoline 1-oxidoreductase alpha subunit
MTTQHVSVTVNGEVREADVEPRLLLVHLILDTFGLTGTHVGCDTSNCGACTVHVDGEAQRSCLTTLSEVEGKEVVTIEGLHPEGNHPVQVAWRELSVPQCGFCQAGQIMQASALLAATPNPTDQEILDGMRDNICRCGCYQRIVAAVRVAATGI